MSRRRRLAAATLAALALASLTAGVIAFAAPRPATAQQAPNVALGRHLFEAGCSSCHGIAARGIPGRGPSLIGVGALAADFYVSTGRMPLAHPTDYPVRAPSVYTRPQREALIAYVGSLGGPPIPAVNPAAGNLAYGKELFTEHCAGCHQVMAQAGIITPNVIAPSLQNHVTATDVAEAVRIGPYIMPHFTEQQIDQHQLDSIARYVLNTQTVNNPGGWGIGEIGPVPEGMVTFLIGLFLLIVVARIIGERTAP